MSIEFSPVLDRLGAATARITPKLSSPKRTAANRRNARKSTGPRSAAGKRRASQNSLKHGLCASLAIPSCEDGPTFTTFVQELRDELQPATVMQKILFDQIAQLMWNLRRFPEAQAKMFQCEIQQTQGGEKLSPSDLLAERFSQTPANGFALLGRYERASQAMLLRLMTRYEQLKKHHPQGRSDPEEDRIPRPEKQPAFSEGQRVQQEMRFQRRREDRARNAPARNLEEVRIDEATIAADEYKKRTHDEPTENPAGESRIQHSPSDNQALVTKRTHQSGLATSDFGELSRVVASIPPPKM